jgi:hypothetical protein
MSIKASLAYDKAGLKATKSLVDHIRQIFGRTVPDSLRGEPSSLGLRVSQGRNKSPSKGSSTAARKMQASRASRK